MELRQYLSILRRRAVLILVLVLSGALIAWLATPKTHKYTAHATVYVGPTTFDVGPDSTARVDPTLLVSRLIKTYAIMLDSEAVATDAVQATGVQRTPSEVTDEATVSSPQDSALLNLSVTDRDPEVARNLANGMADAFAAGLRSNKISPAAGAPPGLAGYVFERATVPSSPDSTGLLRNILLASFFALLIGIGLALLLEQFDQTLKTTRDAESRLRLPVLGFVPYSQLYAAGVLAPVLDAAASPRQLPQNPGS